MDPGAAAGFGTEGFAGPDLGVGWGGAANLGSQDHDLGFQIFCILYSII